MSSSLSASLNTLLALNILLLISGVLVLNNRLSSRLRGLLLRGSPLRRTSPLGLLPGAEVGELTATGALARAAELNGQVLSGDLGEKLLLVSAAEDVDLADGDGVKETLDGTEDGAEAPGRVDQVKLAKTLGVVVLRDVGGLLDVPVDRWHTGDANTLQVHNGAAGLEELASLARASRQTGVSQLLVLGHQVLQHAIGSGDLVHLVQVDLAQLLDVDRAAILFVYRRMSVLHRGRGVLKSRKTNLVGLVVVLRVELEDLLLLGVVEVAS